MSARRRRHSWSSRLERRPLLLSAVAALITIGAAIGMSWAAGPHAVRDRVEDLVPVWLAVAAGARLLSYVGYTVAHRRVTAASKESRLEAQTAARVVTFGAGATSLKGGFSIDARALRGAGASRREASAHVAALALLEYCVLAFFAWIGALTLIGAPHAQAQVVWPWVLGVPAGTAIALLAYRRAGRRRRGRSAGVRTLLQSADILAGLRERPRTAAASFAGMALYWLAEAAALWAGLRAFGAPHAPAVAMVGLATGFVFTPRGLPLAGAGIAEVLVPVSLTWLGVPLPAAVLAALAAELTRLAVSVPFAVLARREVHRLVGLEERGAQAAEREPGDDELTLTGRARTALASSLSNIRRVFTQALGAHLHSLATRKNH
jgi:glycosyltransferase 2 family protein